MPARSDLVKLYAQYYTHMNDLPDNSLWRKFVHKVYEGYLNLRYGYLEGNKGWVDKMLGCLVYLHPGRRADLDVYIKFLPAHVGGKLLEIGCGSGGKLAHLKKFGWDVEGVDFDSTAVEIARLRGLKIRLGELEEQTYSENRFDAVVSSHVLEHVPEPIGFLKECYRLLKPGGQLVFTTPNAGSYGHQIFRSKWRGLEPPRHLHLFTEDSLRYAAAIAGFQNIRCHATGRGGYALFASLMLKKHGTFSPHNLTLWNKLERLMCYYVEWLVVRINGRLGTELLLRAEK
jgi:2-polyprenyl-3-methyl-5-hydroxy-6-metoxy-1,4-benzoquinol methylase